MPKILFASNSIAHFPGSVVSSQPYAFDATRVPYAIEAPLGTPVSSPDIPVTTTDETWFHFVNSAAAWWSNGYEQIAQVIDDLGNIIFTLSYQFNSAAGYRLQSFVGGNSFTNVRYLPTLAGRSRTYDIRLRMTSLNCRIEVYMNEILIEVQDYPIASFRPVKAILLGGATNSGGQQLFSEIIVADGDTRNARMNLLRPQAVGAYNDWLGAVSTLSDDNPTTGMTTTEANQDQTTLLTAYTGAANISNVVQMTTTVRGINSPDRLKHIIRKSGVDHLSPHFTLPFVKNYQITDWALNPSTSLPWTAADLAGMEFGFRSEETP